MERYAQIKLTKMKLSELKDYEKNNKIIWKDIEGYEGLYQVNNLGEIKKLGYYKQICKNKNKTFIEEHSIKSSDRGDGYCRVNLWKDGKCKQMKTHRLVALAFIPNPEKKRTVNHKDGNPSNNKLENLEWMTDSENNKHSYDYLGRKSSFEGLKGILHPRHKLYAN